MKTLYLIGFCTSLSAFTLAVFYQQGQFCITGWFCASCFSFSQVIRKEK